MRALAVCQGSAAYVERVREVAELARELLPKAGVYPGGRGLVERLLVDLERECDGSER
eukprot:COSAG05_NODE_1099_length_5888_cov_9.758335_6_plen_58_part_00